MQDVKRWRESWAEVEAFETELIRKMTIQEKVQEYLDLMAETWMWKPEVEADYQAEREAMLIALQKRLRKIGRYEAKYGSTRRLTRQAAKPTRRTRH